MENMPLKRIRLKNATNVRDLGGFENGRGEVVKWNRLFRADDISGLEDGEWQRLAGRGVRTVIDLRSRSEAMERPDRPPVNIEWMHCPLQTDELDLNDVGQSARRAFAGSLEEGYCQMVETHPELLAQAVKRVIEGLERGAVLFHCTAGKDRTGVLAAAILHLLDVEDEDIVADYQVSAGYIQRGIVRALQGQSGYEQILPFLKSDAASMQALLECFRRVKLERLILENGLTEKDLELLKMLVLEKIM